MIEGVLWNSSARIERNDSGDGGDELFCGYTRYSTGYKLFSSLKRMPKYIRKNIANFLRNIQVDEMNNIIEKLPSKVHNPTEPPVFIPASFCFVKLRQF